MNLKIVEGKIAVNAQGLPETVSGLSDFLQQAKFILAVPLGSFLYDRGFGSTVAFIKKGEKAERIIANANEALSQYSQMKACSAEIREDRVMIEIETPKGKGTVILVLKGEENDLP
ncbi:hypothetical protein [Scatolibacter rhodanostii]|uniref:hypothetical protein n=1 Tax=Scatolibacter rhodanostii TaxID=2014781 RepID=UPI000C085A5A|nr:hypothetical protein [Scatolibacter rhodanostii]